MKKLISILLIMTMILSCLALVGCEWWRMWSKDPPGTMPSEELVSNMRWDYLRTFDIKNVAHDDVDIEFCAGLYNEYIVAMVDASRHTYEKVIENVGGVDFLYYDTNRLTAYKDGKFLSLEEAYSNRILSVQNLKDISNKLAAKFTYYYQVCDFHDYPRGTSSTSFYGLDADYKSDRLKVILGPSGEMPPLSFFNDTYALPKVIEVIDVSHELKYYHDKYGTIFVEIVLDQPYFLADLEALANALIQKPGVDCVGAYWPPLVGSDGTASLSDNVDQWGLESINIEKLWQFTTGSSRIGIGIIDTGIYQHEDISYHLDLSNSKDFKNPNGKFTDDPMGHGTFVAGIIGSITNNNIGIDGTLENTTLYSLQVVQTSDELSYIPGSRYGTEISAIIEAINYAKEKGFNIWSPMRILNYSIQGTIEEQANMLQAINNYYGLIVACAGNESINLDNNPRYPQSYDLDNIIVVGGLNRSGNIHTTSNYGFDTVDIYAPGMDIYSTLPNNTYGTDSGTSFAAPYVTGVAALLLSIKDDLTPAQLKECIVEGGDIISITLSNGSTQAVKKLNAFGAMKYLFDHYYVTHHVIGIQGLQINKTISAENDCFSESNLMMKVTIETVGDYTFNFAGSNVSGAYLYNQNLDTIQISTSTDESEESITLTHYLLPGEYYVRISYDPTYLENMLSVSIDYSNHLHRYTNCAPLSSTQHRSYCDCGDLGAFGSHSVRSSDIVGNLAPCIACGYIVRISDFGGFTEIIHRVTKLSLNGSYILPNGIIVLVDEDVEAYLDGTLVFYDKDKVPEAQ